jgi:NTP pyrophosphatase (non-canonical NTP hydrolase)
MSSYAEVEMLIVQWAEARGIVQNGKHIGQSRKTLEEAGELIEAIGNLDGLNTLINYYPELAIRPEFKELLERTKKAVRDAIGDIGVTLIVGCAVADMNLVDCLYEAYDEIKDRKGYLRADGVFVKEQ